MTPQSKTRSSGFESRMRCNRLMTLMRRKRRQYLTQPGDQFFGPLFLRSGNNAARNPGAMWDRGRSNSASASSGSSRTSQELRWRPLNLPRVARMLELTECFGHRDARDCLLITRRLVFALEHAFGVGENVWAISFSQSASELSPSQRIARVA